MNPNKVISKYLFLCIPMLIEDFLKLCTAQQPNVLELLFYIHYHLSNMFIQMILCIISLRMKFLHWTIAWLYSLYVWWAFMLVFLAGSEVNKQAVLCHRVLRTLQSVASSSGLSEETWHTLLLFLLHVNAALLAPPAVKGEGRGGQWRGRNGGVA